MSNQASASFLSVEDMTTQPSTYTVEANGVRYAPMVLLDAYTAMRDERDRAIRQRDHARALATHLNAMITDEGYSATMYLHGAPDGLRESDDDGWRVEG